jgi:hypothetical protein
MMTHSTCASFSQHCLQGFLQDFGHIDFGPATRFGTRADIPDQATVLSFQPFPQATPGLLLLGTLGKMAAQPCLLRSIDHRILASGAENNANSRAPVAPISAPSQPPVPTMLWILSPNISDQTRSQIAAITHDGCEQGLYCFAPDDHRALVAIDELPRSPDTLWLRLLGQGEVLQQAVEDLMGIACNHPHRRRTIAHLAMLRINLVAERKSTHELKEIVMKLSPAYEKWRRDTLAEGRNAGHQAGHQEGETQGRQQEREELTLKLLQENIALETIAKVTGFSIEQLQTVQQQLKRNNI